MVRWLGEYAIGFLVIAVLLVLFSAPFFETY